MLGGVAAGVSEYLGVDLTVVRLAWVVLGLVGGVAVPLYVAAWLLIPEEDAATSIAEDLFHRFAGA
jgi:phage shock protein PspC (stress-responsive transcriptional regulator)